MSTQNFKQPNLLDRLACLFFGHKILYDGFIKNKATPTLTEFKYAEDGNKDKMVGLCFCARCYNFVGIHYTQERVNPTKLQEAIAASKQIIKPKTKAKAKPKTKKK